MELLPQRKDPFYVTIYRFFLSVWVVLFPASYARRYYKVVLNKKLDLKKTTDYNEKVQWLKVYSDLTQWTELADKYQMRSYIEKCGLNHILVKLYGVWENADDIDFSLLPDAFVLKLNSSSGKNLLVYDKNNLDIIKTKKILKNWMKIRYGLVSFEPHYWSIKRRIIAEELLEDINQNKISASLIDYKFFCFHGEPYIVNIILDRSNEVIGTERRADSSFFRENVYDTDWNIVNDAYSQAFPCDQLVDVPKPKCLEEMLSVCRILSHPFPQVRIDLYEVNGKVYFGEFTFTPGEQDVFSPELLMRMGARIDLNKAIKRKGLFSF